ncbi:uncharacterized protein [Diadema antillarum]|uniref:uncharacterized protein n=1 Tax=Diadema antillarum TaxID=105358 RepID=UPI003A87B7D2
MEVPSEQKMDRTVTYVQVLNVTDVAEAAAVAAAQLGQTPGHVMQIVTIPAPNTSTEPVMTTIHQTVPSEAPPSVSTSPSVVESKPNVNNDNSGSGTVSSGEKLCLICGDRANGVHYNVLSCEGCKSFFLRSNRSGATFTCAQGGNCNMDLYTRRHCPACRMKRCLEMGMKVERVWDKDRLQTRKPLIRRKRKKKQPGVVQEPPAPASIPPASPLPVSIIPASVAPTPQPQPLPSGAQASLSTSPSSTRSNSPSIPTSTPTVTPVSQPPNAAPGIPPSLEATATANPAVLQDLPPATHAAPGTSTQMVFTQPQGLVLTPAQEQLMQTLERGYNASTEVLKHLSKDVPLFRKTYWSKLKGSEESANDIQDGDEDDELVIAISDPKKMKLMSDPDTISNTNSNQQANMNGADAAANASPKVMVGTDPLAILSAATGQSIDVIYKLTSFATNGQIKDPTSALNVLASSEQGMRVIQTIGALVQGQNLDTLISLSKLVGQIIGTGGGLLNDTLADTILGSITGNLNGSFGVPDNVINAQLLQSVPGVLAGGQDANGNESVPTAVQDESINNLAVARLASSGLAEALAMLAAMASSSQNKETIVEMVKRAAVSLLKGEDEPQMMSFSSSQASSPSCSNFYMPTDVGEDEVKTSPFLQSLQRVTSFLTSGKMGSGSKSSGKAKRTVNKEMLHIAMDMFAVLVKQTIHFAKSIPGFTKLSCDDQAVLIKSSIVDALLLRCADSYALDKDCLVNDTNGDKFDVHMMYQLGFSTLPEVVFEFMRDTKACGLTTAEYALFTAAALLSPDRSDLKDRQMVEQMQLEMVLALQAATKVFHADKPFLFTKLITKLTTLRDMSILHLSEIMAVKVQEQDLSPLIVELFGLDS